MIAPLRSLLVVFLLLVAGTGHAETAPKITILYDAFGADPTLKKGWGYSALIEYGGRRILFDTGGNLEDFRANVARLHVDLTHLDFVILSHRHGDHTGGLNEVLRVNPDVPIFTPVEAAQFATPRSSATLKQYLRDADGVSADLRYFGGEPQTVSVDTPPWPHAHFNQIRQTTEILPGFFLVTNQSDVEGTREMNEISLAIRTPRGLVVVVGCSHPGIEKILTNITGSVDPHLYALFGGLHLVTSEDGKITQLVENFRDKWAIERLAVGHCTGQFAFATLIRLYGDHFDHAGVGNMIALPAD